MGKDKKAQIPDLKLYKIWVCEEDQYTKPCWKTLHIPSVTGQVAQECLIVFSTGPNSLPTKIWKLIFPYNWVAYLISLFFGIFPSKLKIAKIIPIHKKESKLICSNYIPISLLSNIDKILEDLMYDKLNFLCPSWYNRDNNESPWWW